MILNITEEMNSTSDLSDDISNRSSNSSRRSARLLMNNTDGSGIVFDVIHTGVPTNTTATVTPTMLKNIEQFLEMPEVVANEAQTHQGMAGFVPPITPFPSSHFQAAAPQSQPSTDDEDDDEDMSRNNNTMMNEDDYNSMEDEEELSNCSWQTGQTTETPPPMLKGTGRVEEKKTPRRNMGGRRPNKPSNLSPEEEAKRKVRRERNKLAAARCRKRRVDHTNELCGEVEGLEKKKQNLQNDIHQLQQQKEELEFLLDNHRDQCRMFGRSSSPLDIKPQHLNQILDFADKIKSEPEEFDQSKKTMPPANNEVLFLNTPTTPLLNNNPLMSSSAMPAKQTLIHPSLSHLNPDNMSSKNVQRPNRPSSLAVPLTMTPAQALGMAKSGDFSGIPISTPSNGIFNFDSLMDGGTGLTPMSSAPLIPNSSANRNPLDLVTPTTLQSL